MQGENHHVARREGAQNPGMMDDLDQAEQPDRQKPHSHDRPEKAADLGRAALLKAKSPPDDQAERGLHRPGRRGVTVLQAFDRGQHRDGRGDDAVAVEQRRADDATSTTAEAPAVVGVARASAIMARMPPSP